MSRCLAYLKFLLKSTNEHGVHSPFVYNYLTKCLYQRPNRSQDRLQDVLLKSVTYFECKNAQTDDLDLKILLPDLQYDAEPIELIVLQHFKLNHLLRLMEQGKTSNKALIVIPNLLNQQKEWKKAVAHSKITVSIDCFQLGILFIRKEQAKEHFIIRL